MEASEIAKFLRFIAEVIETNPDVAKAVKEHLDKNNSLPKVENFSEPIIKHNNSTTKKYSNGTTLKKPENQAAVSKLDNSKVNGEVLLSKSREILRGQDEVQLKKYLIEQGENVREMLKYGHLDPNRTIRRRKNLDSIIEHIIRELIAQDKSGTLLAKSVDGL